MDLFDSMKVFVETVERGSLSAAAVACDMSATMAGNHLRALETRLGTKLLHRTTRRQSLSSFGQGYYARCQEILRLIKETDVQAEALQAVPTGQLRVTAPVSFGTEALMPALCHYTARYPEVRVDVSLLDRMVDLVEEGFEAAIRIGPLPDSGLVARPLAPYRMMICASPAYLAQRGTPHTPNDLSRHECLAFSHAARSHWRLREDERDVIVPATGRLQANHGQALRVAALHGAGIIMQPAVLLEDDVRAGRLVRLLEAFEPPGRPMHLVYLQDRYRSPKLRSFVEFVVEQFA